MCSSDPERQVLFTMLSNGPCSSLEPPSTPDAADESWATSCLRDSAYGDDEYVGDDAPNYPADYSDSIPQPNEILGTLFSAEFESQLQETEIFEVSPFRNPLVPGAAEFQTWDSEDDESPNSAMAATAARETEDLSDIFRVWDLNTEDPELETCTLTEILSSSLDRNSLRDSPEVFKSPLTRRSADAFDLKALDSALDEAQDVNSLIADMAGLNISVSGVRRNSSG